MVAFEVGLEPKLNYMPHTLMLKTSEKTELLVKRELAEKEIGEVLNFKERK
jgi:hypothetical protein